MTYRYWSDLHLRHTNIIQYGNRPFETVEQMDAALVDAWKQTFVDDPETKLIFLGDLCLWNKAGISRIHQHPVMRLEVPRAELIILGNHDNGKLARTGIYEHLFKTVKGDSDLRSQWNMLHRDQDRLILLSHAPMPEEMMTPNLINFHGHIHNDPRPSDRHFNCSVEVLGYRPRTFEEVIQLNQEFYDS